jgi:hypothetical protein
MNELQTLDRAPRTLSPPLQGISTLPHHVISTCRSDYCADKHTAIPLTHPAVQSRHKNTMAVPHYQQPQPDYSATYALRPEEHFTVEELEALAHSLTHANNTQIYSPEMDPHALDLWKQHSDGGEFQQTEGFGQGISFLGFIFSDTAEIPRLIGSASIDCATHAPHSL